MSLIRIRGRTILAPILSEQERLEARALRERAIQFQHERQRVHQHHLPQCQMCHHQQENQQKAWSCDRCSNSHDRHSSSSERASDVCRPLGSNRASPSVSHCRQREGQETSSSSGPSSGEPMSEGPEDSPSAANASVQTESSVSLTASTDLRSYLNTSIENSLDTSISASNETWHQSSSLADVDEALLLSASPEVATNLILGRLHPSAVLHPSTKLRSSQADSQHTETASTTLVQGQQSLEQQATSENHDTTATASLSLSFASVSEEGGEGSGDGLEVSEEILEVSEEAIDGSEEDRAGSLPSEVESDSHKEEDNQRHTTQITLQKRSPQTIIGDVGKSVRDGGMRDGTSVAVREVRDMREPSWMLQRDSGRSSSHSDYLDDYLELLTSRCSSGLGLEANVLSVTTCKASAPITTSTTTSRVMTTSTSVGVNIGDKQKENGNRQKERKLEEWDEKAERKGEDGDKAATNEDTKKIRSPRELQRTRDMLGEPRSLSAASERRVSRRSRARRWSSGQPLDPGRSVGSKYLDSYLGNLTDDAWLQYPTQLTSRRMVFLNSDEYIHSVRPQAVKKPKEDNSSARECSESSASEDSRRPDTSVTSSDDLSITHGQIDSLEEQSKKLPSKNGKVLTRKQVSVGEDQPVVPQDISQTPQLNLGSDNENIPNRILSSKSNQQNQESMDLSFGIQDVQENSLHEVPETPSDKAETKVSSDEGIELLGSPASLGSDGKLAQDACGSMSSSKEEVSVEEKETRVITPSPSQCKEVTADQDKNDVEVMVPAFKVGEVVGITEGNEECQDSSSEDSSETEPSTIVYVDDYPIESEGHKNSLVESEGKNKSQIDSKGQTSTQIDSKEQSNFQEGDDKLSSETEECVEKALDEKGTVLVHEEATSPPKDSKETCNELLEKHPLISDIQLAEASKHVAGIKESETSANPVMYDEKCPENGQNKKELAEYDIYDSEDECLVVQVYEDQSIISHGEVRNGVKLGREGSAESDYVEEVVKIVPQRRDRMKNGTDISCELVPYKDSEDAMGQVLTLLRAKQQQELEELRLRQEEEVRQFIKQLQNVSPEHLHAFLAASNASGSSESSRSGDGNLYVMSQTSLETKSVVRPSIENDDCRDRNMQQTSNITTESFKEASAYCDSEVNMVSSSQISVPSTEKIEVIPSVIPTQPGHAKEWSSQPGSLSSTTTHPLLVPQSCPFTCQPVTTHLPLLTLPPVTTHSPTSSEKAKVESPKPRPSNHTNIMPSYIMNEETRKSAGHQENDNYLQLDLGYRPVSPKHTSTHMTHSPHHISFSGASREDSGNSSVEYPLARNNNIDSDDPVSFINGNCVNYGDGMQYYRLCTPDEDLSINEITPKTTVVESNYQSKPTETVTQPGLFKVTNNGPWPSPQPTSITSLLAEHPEMFREDIVEVNLEHTEDWGTSTVGLREPCRNAVDDHIMTHQAAATAEGGLDMVPERESAASVHFLRLSQNVIFVRGIICLQACVRRYMTQRLLRTKFVQEQLATLAEISKLAQQFHRDILTDNIHKGDVDFHKALYNQEGLARERIRRVFFVLSVQEQMSLIRRDSQLWQMEQERQTSTIFRPSPTHSNSSKPKSRNVEDRPRSAIATKTLATKRPSPTAPRPQQDVKARVGSLRGRTSRLVQPSLVHHSSPSHSVNMSGVNIDHKASPRISKLPVQMERSASHIDSTPSHYTKTSHIKSPQDSRSGLLSSNRCASHPRSSSASQIPSRTGGRQASRPAGHTTSVTRSMSCTARSTTHSNSPRRATPPRSANKTSIVGRRPWR